MQRLRDPDRLDFHSDVTYPVGPDASGEITYLHVPPLSALTIITIALACIAVAAFIWCYLYPLIARCQQGRARAAKDHVVKGPLLASARSLFGRRSRVVMSPPPTPPPTPQMLARYARLDMRIARPPPAVSRSRGSWLAPSVFSSSSSSPSYSSSSPSYSSTSSSSSSSSSSPSSSPTSTEMPLRDARPTGVSEVIVTPVDVGMLGQSTAEIRITPKKSGGRYDGHKAEDR